MKKEASSYRVGVLTFHNGPNYGGFLQAWHMIRAIRALGYQAHAVNYLTSVHHQSNQVKIPLRNLSSLKAKIFWMLKRRGFREIEEELCRHSFTTDPQAVPWSDFDILVVGSDVVWNYEDPAFGSDPAYFGGFEEMSKLPLIAYAVSCGAADPDGDLPNFVKSGLERFVRIGVRDQPTARLVGNACDRESELVVDPTWLNEDDDREWSALPTQPYLFAYGGGMDRAFLKKLKVHCRERGLLLVSALSSCPEADKLYRTLEPFQWVQLFKNAQAVVVSGTLHGTVYSLKYNRPFILLNAPATSAKIKFILEKVGQLKRLFEPGTVGSNDLARFLKSEGETIELPQEWITQSRSFLSESLALACENIERA